MRLLVRDLRGSFLGLALVRRGHQVNDCRSGSGTDRPIGNGSLLRRHGNRGDTSWSNPAKGLL